MPSNNSDNSKKHYAVIPFYILASNLTDGEKVICAIIDGYNKVYGECRIGYDVMAQMVGKKETAIRMSISRLYDKGVVLNIGNKQNRNLKLAYIDVVDVEELPVQAGKTAPSTATKEENFTKFWELYPRKEHKAAAKKQFMKLSLTKQEFVIATLPKYLEKVHDTEQRYILLPGTYLNQRVYEDFEVMEPPKQQEKTANGGGAVPMWRFAWSLAEKIKADPARYKDMSLEAAAGVSGYPPGVTALLVEYLGDIEFLLDQSYDRSAIKSIFYEVYADA